MVLRRGMGSNALPRTAIGMSIGSGKIDIRTKPDRITQFGSVFLIGMVSVQKIRTEFKIGSVPGSLLRAHEPN